METETVTTGQEVRTLVCEGSACNPNLDIAEAMVRDYRRDERARRVAHVEPVYDERVLGIVKRQVHTQHTFVRPTSHGASFWRCTVCGHERKF